MAASKGFDYSKWDHLQLSDDDDDTLPSSIDKESYHKVRRQQREGKKKEQQDEYRRLGAELKRRTDQLAQYPSALRESETCRKLVAEIEDLQLRRSKLEKRKILDGTNICRDGEENEDVVYHRPRARAGEVVERQASSWDATADDSATPAAGKAGRTAAAPALAGDLPENFSENDGKYYQFAEAYQGPLERLLALKPFSADVRRQLLTASSVLLDERAETYCLFDALEKQVAGERAAALRAAQHSHTLKTIRELARAFGRDREPEQVKDAVVAVWAKLEADAGVEELLHEGSTALYKNVKRRAVEKKRELNATRDGRDSDGDDVEVVKRDGEVADEEAAAAAAAAAVPHVQCVVEADEDGNVPTFELNASEVFASLPAEVQEAFQDQNIGALHAALAALPKKEAKMHMQRCEQCGLWAPAPGEVPPYMRDSEEDSD